jgi:hypothetical protein
MGTNTGSPSRRLRFKSLPEGPISSFEFSVIFLSFQENNEKYRSLGDERFLPCTFHFAIHYSSYNMSYCKSHKRMVKVKFIKIM